MPAERPEKESSQGLKPKRLVADTAYGTGKFLGWLIGAGVTPHIPVWDKSAREDGTFSRADFTFDKERNVYICPAGKLLKTTGRILRLHAALHGEHSQLRPMPPQIQVLPELSTTHRSARRQ